MKKHGEFSTYFCLKHHCGKEVRHFSVQCIQTKSIWPVLQMPSRCGSLSITTPVTFLVNEFDVRRVLHTELSVAAVNHIYVFHEVMKCCKNLKIH